MLSAPIPGSAPSVWDPCHQRGFLRVCPPLPRDTETGTSAAAIPLPRRGVECKAPLETPTFGDIYHVTGVECKAPLETPTFGDIYHVTGVISLPYAEIREPFEAWYNLTGGKSRIEYYGGQVVTYQFGSIEPFGASFKVTPETTETEVNVRKCFRINGTDGDLVAPQSVFPSLENFKWVREERFRGQRCAVWQNVSYWGHKKNVYTLRVGSSARGPVPLHYEVRGFNSLLGSHYDKYEIDYSSFSHRFPPGIFRLPEGECPRSPRSSACGLTRPESLDWRLYGAVTPVKDQAVCGSCWSFATTGAMEGALFLKTGVLTPLSQQVLIDCSWGFGNYACDGGEEWRAYEWIKKHGGIASTESYGTYKGQNGLCHYNQSEMLAKITGYVNVTSGNITAVKAAIYTHPGLMGHSPMVTQFKMSPEVSSTLKAQDWRQSLVASFQSCALSSTRYFSWPSLTFRVSSLFSHPFLASAHQEVGAQVLVTGHR
ncbi:PREDICTED: uncharacterized protein LOC104294789 [Charadrius vociferus]|uniref:uncharacterized protein LOC104294789 n=1 Tax=Charadrius vociferus TaxID=50402 RepID=UPI0005214EEC|nr:PREDICTED: uncharacterized protein LOC104294789 [Charadrius vociferus]